MGKRIDPCTDPICRFVDKYPGCKKNDVVTRLHGETGRKAAFSQIDHRIEQGWIDDDTANDPSADSELYVSSKWKRICGQ